MEQEISSNDFVNPIQKDHPYFDERRKVFNGAIDRIPACIFIAHSVEDVLLSIEYARSHNLKISVKSGGHSAYGQSVSDNQLLIDLCGLKEIKVAEDQTLVEVGGGVLSGELDLALAKVNRAIPLGDCPDVGVTGLALGGGNGFLSRKFGLTCDHITEIELVTSDGEVRVVNSTFYPDLFWAMKGAGHNNFGVVTKLTFKLITPPSTVSTFNYYWSSENASTVLSRMEYLFDEYADDLSLFPRFNYEYEDSPGLRLYGIYLGTPSIANAIAKVLHSTQPRYGTCSQVTYYEAQQLNVTSIKRDISFHWENAIIPFGLHPDFIADLNECLQSCPNSLGRINLDPIGSKSLDETVSKSSSFAHRSQSYVLSIIGISPGYIVEKDVKEWALRCAERLFKNALPFKYQNYAGMNDPLDCYFGQNVRALQLLKKKYDFIRLFGGLID